MHLLEKGAYEGVDASMMLHPCPPHKNPTKSGSAYAKTNARSRFRIHFTGKPAHAGTAPHEGKNALDAVVLGYTGVSMLRQQIRPYDRIHGIVVKGGDAVNIIPADTALEYGIRSKSKDELVELEQRVRNCFDAAGLATECEIRYHK